jgi:hypothetical protein
MEARVGIQYGVLDSSFPASARCDNSRYPREYPHISRIDPLIGAGCRNKRKDRGGGYRCDARIVGPMRQARCDERPLP